MLEIKEAKQKFRTITVKQQVEILPKYITCCAKYSGETCGKRSLLSKITLLDYQYYVQPFSCSGGAYWTHSEYKFVCPKCGCINRLNYHPLKRLGDYLYRSVWKNSKDVFLERNY